ncbi:restriction endonuclease subunit S [Actinomadura barringtoniae]|uniref:Restriction endonuclease subunit S n=1 Tax=Actinomadura barringtoniae TaxID=1427535 RepID=A0A939PNT8_9ACTN|nr:restriction endonuclease subunit S [Actinomadura barringtoniae]MBO2455428.1 restriction endonuclease subunit S [Actinomadura barringtoniae]
MRLDIERTPMMPATTYRLAGVLNAGQGLVAKGELDGGATEYAAMNVLRVDQVVMRKLTAWEGPITVVPAEFDGFVVSNEFPTFTLGPELVPDWMRHLCRSPRLWAEMKNRVSGTVQRRKRLNPEQLLQIRLPIPPRGVQTGIVEVLDAVDDQIATLEAEAEAATRVRNGLLGEFAGDASTDTKPLGELCPVIGSGPSWAAKDEFPVPPDAGWTVLKITNTKPDGSIDLSKLSYVVGLPAHTKIIGPTSLVMIRTNGNRKRIGNVYLPPEALHGAAVSAFQFILDATDVDTRDYLYLVLRSPRIQNQMSESASGSTGLGNLAVRWLKTLEIPWPDADVREIQVESVRVIDAKIVAVRAEAGRLRSVRARLLAGLLDRTVEIESAELEA